VYKGLSEIPLIFSIISNEHQFKSMKSNFIIFALLVLISACSSPQKQEKAGGNAPEKKPQTEVAQKTETKEMTTAKKQKAAKPAEQTAEKVAKQPAKSLNEGIATNYYDLPDAQNGDLKSLLQAENLEVLQEPTLEVMKRHLQETVLSGGSPFGNRISSNYLWYIYNALPDFVAKMERHQGYHKHTTLENEDDRLMAYSIYRIDRSPENIKRLYKYARPFLTTLIPRELYVSMGINRKVNGLLKGYGQLTSLKDYDMKLKEFYQQTFTPKGEIKDEKMAEGPYGLSVYELNERIWKYFKAQDRVMNVPPGLSFWMRRNHEGNMETVHEILQEIQGMYQ